MVREYCHQAVENRFVIQFPVAPESRLLVFQLLRSAVDHELAECMKVPAVLRSRHAQTVLDSLRLALLECNSASGGPSPFDGGAKNFAAPPAAKFGVDPKTPLSAIGLSERASNILANMRPEPRLVEDVTALTNRELFKQKGMGPKTLAEIRAKTQAV